MRRTAFASFTVRWIVFDLFSKCETKILKSFGAFLSGYTMYCISGLTYHRELTKRLLVQLVLYESATLKATALLHL
jgi:hypothetical protein